MNASFPLDGIRLRRPNWLPLPTRLCGGGAVVEDDLFSKGVVSKFYPELGWGYVKNSRGEEVYFNIDELELVGSASRRDRIKEGVHVGYDVSWTSSGVRIVMLKVY